MTCPSSCTCSRQHGVALVVGLLLLVVMTVLGVTTMKSTVLEERMAGNFRDHDLAFQAAETALRDGEHLVSCNTCSLYISGLTGLDADCTASGLCLGETGMDVTGYLRDGHGIVYGTYTGSTAFSGDVSQPPRFVIEGFKYWPPGAPNWKVIYRITAIGYGGNPDSVSIHQSVYKP